jgi:hypothetical protein
MAGFCKCSDNFSDSVTALLLKPSEQSAALRQLNACRKREHGRHNTHLVEPVQFHFVVERQITRMMF